MPEGSAAVVDAFDVTDPRPRSQAGSTERAPRSARSTILVNNAGEAPSAPFEKTDPGLWSRVLAVNLTGVYLVSRAVLLRPEGARRGRADHQHRLDRGPRRLCLCLRLLRGQARRHRPHAGAGARTRQDRHHGQRRLPRLHRDAADRARRSKPSSRRPAASEELAKAELTKSNPQGRLVRPEEVADTVLWLASPGAASINGQAIAVAGGEVMAG